MGGGGVGGRSREGESNDVPKNDSRGYQVKACFHITGATAVAWINKLPFTYFLYQYCVARTTGKSYLNRKTKYIFVHNVKIYILCTNANTFSTFST